MAMFDRQRVAEKSLQNESKKTGPCRTMEKKFIRNCEGDEGNIQAFARVLLSQAAEAHILVWWEGTGALQEHSILSNGVKEYNSPWGRCRPTIQPGFKGTSPPTLEAQLLLARLSAPERAPHYSSRATDEGMSLRLTGNHDLQHISG